MTTATFIQERKYLKNVSVKTLVWYETSFKAFDGALENRQTVIDRIAELRNRGLSAISVNTYPRAVNAYFQWLHKEHGKAALKIPRLKEEQKILATFSAEHVKRIVNGQAVRSSELRLKALALSALDTGLRIDELLSLTRGQVDLDNLVLRVKGKGNKHRLIPMSVELRKVLYRHLAKHEHALVFCSRQGAKLSQRNLLRDFKIWCTKLGITGVRASWHTLRYSFAVNYLRKGGNLYYLQRILGHSSITTTERYLRSLGIEDLQKVHDGLSLLSR
jgi:integrase/recombinase XerD